MRVKCRGDHLLNIHIHQILHPVHVCNSIFWVDNCSAQNKNWCLLSSRVCPVNANTTSREDITLKYFEQGHTFISADSFHHGVEQQMKNCPVGAVYDFEGFVSVVKSSNSKKVDVVEMKMPMC